eukprot:CAMPEP_0117529132 /NCGR_PEP_ID=MMETSP0784-20121206/37676_1 /TAXON_ID=39447 /ORGANISM="" /LENGTH=40 /DNA_ID= /DNA_START= /DNA_END= /DNA_ORIENTATION=
MKPTDAPVDHVKPTQTKITFSQMIFKSMEQNAAITNGNMQ